MAKGLSTSPKPVPKRGKGRWKVKKLRGNRGQGKRR